MRVRKIGVILGVAGNPESTPLRLRQLIALQGRVLDTRFREYDGDLVVAATSSTIPSARFLSELS